MTAQIQNQDCVTLNVISDHVMSTPVINIVIKRNMKEVRKPKQEKVSK